jgi:hypothetical protein
MTSLLLMNTRPCGGATTSLFGFPAQANAVSDDKLNACAVLHICNIRPVGGGGGRLRYIYVTFGL